MSAARIVVSGLIGQHPRLGGMTWHHLQYVLGLARLGHDVYYVEDSGEWPYVVDEAGGDDVRIPYDCTAGVAHLARTLEALELGDRWAFRCAVDGEWSGMPDRRREDVLATADLLLNVSGSLASLDDFDDVGRRVYIDTDPVFAQIHLMRGRSRFRTLVDGHDLHFTFGERLRGELAQTGHGWLPTRQPIVLDQWTTGEPPGDTFTTVMNAASYGSEEFAGRRFAQKDVELRRYLNLPDATAARFELAIAPTAGEKPEGERRDVRPAALIEDLRTHGWGVADAVAACGDPDRYRRYIQGSLGEWTVAKNGYVEGAAGWFSERSACYLAAGRPVIAQDTGFSEVFPVGEGLLAFTSFDEAVAAVAAVTADPLRHARAARELAVEYFDSAAVLDQLLEAAAAHPVAARG